MVHNGKSHSGMVIRAFPQDNTGTQKPQRKADRNQGCWGRSHGHEQKAGVISGIQMGKGSKEKLGAFS